MTEETYSDALRRLEAIVAELERGGMDLEATLERFEEGSKLLERCQNELKEAEGRLENLRLPDAEALIDEAKKNESFAEETSASLGQSDEWLARSAHG